MMVNLTFKPIHPYLERFGHIRWKKSPPFFANPRGILTHRVRSITTHLHNYHSYGKPDRHHHVDYCCGGGANSSTCEGLTDEPPASRLLCERCEQLAIEAGLPSADELAGRHVHVGRVKPFRTCCRDKEQ